MVQCRPRYLRLSNFATSQQHCVRVRILSPELSPSCRRTFVRSSGLAVQAFAKGAKRGKYSQPGGQTRGEPLFVQVESNGSDAWRLGVVIEGLKAGNVRDVYPKHPTSLC